MRSFFYKFAAPKEHIFIVMPSIRFILCHVLFLSVTASFSSCKVAQKTSAPRGDAFQIIAYYSGNGQDLDRYRFDQLTQVIYSFCHLKGNQLAVDNAADSIAIRNLVALKQRYPQLKVLLSLGGWCGCKACSDVFSTEAGRAEFARSTLALLQTYEADGLDLDWEYPGIEGCPDHPWKPEDRAHFTALIAELRRVLGPGYELSFAAGGFDTFFDQSVEWGKVMPLVNRVNLMSYDLVSGFSTMTGHHTPLYSSARQQRSVDYGVRYLDALGVPLRKIVIGAAFYARTWENVDSTDFGLFKPGKFKSFVAYKQFPTYLSPEKGFVFHRDEAAAAPWAYSAARREFATFDDPISIAAKTKYARKKGLGGIMFWELTHDTSRDGLLQAIFNP